MRIDAKTNFSCAMDPDEKRVLLAKREDTKLSWELFMHYIVEIIKPVRDVEDLIKLKNAAQELKKK